MFHLRHYFIDSDEVWYTDSTGTIIGVLGYRLVVIELFK